MLKESEIEDIILTESELVSIMYQYNKDTIDTYEKFGLVKRYLREQIKKIVNKLNEKEVT